MISYETDKAKKLINDTLNDLDYHPIGQSFWVEKNPDCRFPWNLYCNELKREVTDGWFFFMDDDDFLYSNDSLEHISRFLLNPDKGIICRFIRNGKAKPDIRMMQTSTVMKGRIGGGCIFLHHSKKFIADWDGEKSADFRFIKAVEEKIKLDFVNVIVQEAGNSGLFGK